jgi:hypothetical protein
MTFPIYRKLSNEKSYYKIVSAESFIELQRIGSKTKKHTLIALHTGYLESNASEFERIELSLEN